MHLNSKLIFDKYAKPLFKPGMKVLEIGPDAFPSTYQTSVGDSSITWDTADFASSIYYTTKATYPLTDEYQFPIPTGEYDVVLSAQVIEHVRKCWVWIKEVARVCKPGGLVVTINPISWPYHEAPVDCWRIYPEAMKALYEEAGLQVQTAAYESLERPWFAYLSYLSAKQAAKSLLGGRQWKIEPNIDNIAIGVKL
jgi:SAM-dependent methyltransferase